MFKVTMEDIARELGVSKMTVSRALNKKPGVSRKLILEVEKKSQEMGYKYNYMASSLRKNKFDIYGVIVSELLLEEGESFYTEILKNLIYLLEKNNISTMVYVLLKEAEVKGEIPKMCSQNKIDGLFILGEVSEKYVSKLKGAVDNIVLVDFYLEGYKSIISNNLKAGYEAVNFLYNHGHKCIGFVGNYEYSQSVKKRYEGYKKFVLENKLPFDNTMVLKDRTTSGEILDFNHSNYDITAYVCNNDHTASILIKKLIAKKIKVPDEISIISFDDTIYSRINSPEISTLKVDCMNISKSAVELIKDKKVKSLELNMDLINRQTIRER